MMQENISNEQKFNTQPAQIQLKQVPFEFLFWILFDFN